jgi:hypothetical protein
MSTEITIAMNDRGSATAVGVDILPHREDVVATWLRQRRDEIQRRSVGYDSRAASSYDAIDALLDEYRLRADLGLGLTAEIPGEAQR